MSSRPSPRVSHRSILAVDDTPDDLFILARLLLRAEINVRLQTASGGPEAIGQLERLVRADEIPLVAFVDARMPTIDGFALLQWMRARAEFDRMPVVMLSDEVAPRGLARAAQLGAQAYLHKGVTAPQLRAILEYAAECEKHPTSLRPIPCPGNLLSD